MPFARVGIEISNDITLAGRMQQICHLASFEVPTYQRTYTWEEVDFVKLLNDLAVLRVTPEFEGDPNCKAHYMGNLFFLSEPTEEWGGMVHQIIDGQQRLTTCLIFLSIIFFELKVVLGHQDLDLPDHFQAKYINLRNCFHNMILMRDNGAWVSRFKAGYREYPLARFIEHLANNQPNLGDVDFDFNDPSTFTPAQGSSSERIFLTSVRSAKRVISGHLKPDPQILEEGPAAARGYGIKLLKLAVQIMEGLQFGVLTITDEEDAYNVFVDLNSKGRPLTHFEVFKARIDRKITYYVPSEGDQIEIRSHLGHIQNQLTKFGRAVNQQNAKFDEALQYWRVYDQIESDWDTNNGAVELAVQINDQNTTGGRIVEILSNLLNITSLLKSPEAGVKGTQAEDPNQVQLLCLKLIHEEWPMGIHLVLPFYLNPNVTVADYTRALKKLVAFWTLYRMIQTNRDTGGIQHTYKEPLLRPNNANPGAPGLPMRGLTVENLERGLKQRLAGCTNDLELDINAFIVNNHPVITSWSRISSAITSNNHTVNRVILMFAYHDTIHQSPAPYVPDTTPYVPNVTLVATNPNYQNRLTYAFFTSFVKGPNATLEHVRPQGINTDLPWEGVDRNSIELIGNMHLAPRSTNASLSNCGPRRKKFLYKYFAQIDDDGRDEVVEEMGRNYEMVGDNEIRVLINEDHTIFYNVFNFEPWVPGNPEYPVWNDAAIRARGRDVCQRAVANLFIWLNA